MDRVIFVQLYCDKRRVFRGQTVFRTGTSLPSTGERQEGQKVETEHNGSRLLLVCGVTGIVGSLAAIAANIVGIDMYCVYALGPLFALPAVLLAWGVREHSRRWAGFSLAVAIAWMILAPLLFAVPTSWDGAYERFVAMLMVVWLMGVSLALVFRGLGKAPPAI